MMGAEVMVTTGAAPPVLLPITTLAAPVPPPTVCDAVTVTKPSGKPLTSRLAVVQPLLPHVAVADRAPTWTTTAVPLTEQVPETV